MGRPNLELIADVRRLADGTHSSQEIAEILGRNPRHIRKILTKYDLPRLNEGARSGAKNQAYVSGRRINHNGYAMVTAPESHPHAKKYGNKKTGWIFEHRLVLEQKLGRYLLPEERVDHIDELTLHNHPDNLRLFGCNAAHLQSTLGGKVPHWSAEGRANMSKRHHQPTGLVRVDIHRQRTAAGATRLRQILRLALQHGKDNPYLLGSSRWLAKAGIDLSSRSMIERALVDLCHKWGWPHPL